MIRRREFITLLSGAAAWPLAARAQQPGRMRRVGVLAGMGESDPEAQSTVEALDQTLQGFGWVEGRNLRIDRRWGAGNPGRIATFAKALIALEPDVIVAHGTPAVIALRKETGTIPIVFVQVTDPIDSGFIANLAHPGGNMTGFTSQEPSMVGKWVEMLKEMAPRISRVAFLFNPETAPYIVRSYQGPLESSARSLGILPSASPVHNPSEIESAITALAREPGGGLVVTPDAFNIVHRERIIALAAQNKLPAISPYRFMVAEGLLMSYGLDMVDLFRRAAAYVDRILKGAKPTDLPVQAPVKFVMAINLKATKSLGLTVPQMLLVAADEVIE
jgi:putative ABC transport system substrate-binding protein